MRSGWRGDGKHLYHCGCGLEVKGWGYVLQQHIRFICNHDKRGKQKSQQLRKKLSESGKTIVKNIMLSAPNKGHVVDKNVQIAASGNNVYVTWWTNKTEY
jgi:hypothetical protein